MSADKQVRIELQDRYHRIIRVSDGKFFGLPNRNSDTPKWLETASGSAGWRDSRTTAWIAKMHGLSVVTTPQ